MSWENNPLVNEPMEIFMGGMLLPSEVQDAVDHGWSEGVNAFINSSSRLHDFLAMCETHNRTCYISLTDGFDTEAQLDTLIRHPGFRRVRGLEVEARAAGSRWDDALWTTFRDKLADVGAEDKLYAYQGQYDKPDQFPNAAAWKHRSKLWYPYYNGDATESYNPGRVDESAKIVGICATHDRVRFFCEEHNLSEGQVVTLRFIEHPSLLHLNDRQYELCEVQDNSFCLKGVSVREATAAGPGGYAITKKNGRTLDKSVRHDMPMYPLRQSGGFARLKPENKIHLWLQSYGQPMEPGRWNDNFSTAIQPGIGHYTTFLWLAHVCGCRMVSFYTFRVGVFDNFHSRNRVNIGSPINVLPDVGRNDRTPLDEEEEATYERTWAWLNQVVDDYMLGPGAITANIDNAWGYETPWVGVVKGGQHPTRR